MPTPPALLLTIDTEGDNMWARPREITTRNARWLPRFQGLCERHGLKPTYLTNYEMATDPAFVDFGRDVLARGTGEIGMHLHAWHSPPFDPPLSADDQALHAPLIMYPAPVLRAKVAYMTGLLEDTFGTRMRSHRAGRWGLDGTYARALAENGYTADCSVTPHIVWFYDRPGGGAQRTVDYRRAPETPYRLDATDVTQAGELALLELPMTVMRTDPALFRPLRDALPPASLAARALAKLVATHSWLRPRRGNLREMVWLLDEVVRRGRAYAQLIIHSSELMPGGSPYFPERRDIDALFEDLEALFAHARRTYRGATLAELTDRLAARACSAGLNTL